MKMRMKRLCKIRLNKTKIFEKNATNSQSATDDADSSEAISISEQDLQEASCSYISSDINSDQMADINEPKLARSQSELLNSQIQHVEEEPGISSCSYTDNSANNVTSPTHSEYSDEPKVDQIETDESMTDKLNPSDPSVFDSTNIIKGNRITELGFLLNWALDLRAIHNAICPFGRLYLHGEIRSGYASTLEFKCTECSITEIRYTYDPSEPKANWNVGYLSTDGEMHSVSHTADKSRVGDALENQHRNHPKQKVADKVNTPPVVKVEVSAESCLNDDLPGPSYESEQDPLQVPAVKSNIMVKPKITVLKKLRKIYVTKDGRPAMPSKNQRRDDLNKSALPLLVIRSPGSLGVPRLLFKEKQPTVSAIANVPTRNEPTSTMANVPTRNEPTSTIMNAVARGNRIVDIQQVLERLQAISCHNLSNGCTLGDVRVCSEHSEGLLSELRLHCDRCGTDFTLALASSVDNNGQVTDLNSAAVARTTSAGLTHRQLIDLLTALGIPNVVTDTFTEEMFNDINAMQKANKDNTIFIKEEPFDIDIKEELF